MCDGSRVKAQGLLRVAKIVDRGQQSRARDSSVLVESAIREWITLVGQNFSPHDRSRLHGRINLKIVPALGMLPLADKRQRILISSIGISRYKEVHRLRCAKSMPSLDGSSARP